MQVLEPKPKEKMPKLSEEDDAMWKEATRHYNKAKLSEHRMWQTDISIKIQLREAALAALPGTALNALNAQLHEPCTSPDCKLSEAAP